jgi:ribosomal protein S18 acetylase RimI-like enzyme
VQDIRIVAETPDPREYCDLRLAAGLSPRTVAAATRGLPATLFAVCARDGDRLVGMGRVIGDGGLNYEIVDMAVEPDYQRRGVGYRMMELLMRYIHGHAPESAYVCLLADDGAPALYEKFGFEFTGPRTVGMALNIGKTP